MWYLRTISSTSMPTSTRMCGTFSKYGRSAKYPDARKKPTSASNHAMSELRSNTPANFRSSVFPSSLVKKRVDMFVTLFAADADMEVIARLPSQHI